LLEDEQQVGRVEQAVPIRISGAGRLPADID
jgi:hypothetical protein